MSRSLPGWLLMLIGVLLIVVVGSAVLFYVHATQPAGVAPSATAPAGHASSPAAALTASSQVNVTPHSATPARATGTGAPTVFLIVLENHNWSDIKNNPSAPYINQTLLPMASYSQQYFNPPGNHPSEPNYLWLEAGTNFGINADGHPGTDHQQTTQHLVTLLNNAHISWRSYQEGISGTVCPLTGNGLYAPKHNPMVYFDDVTNTNDPRSPYCIAHVRPSGELSADVRHNTQARYNFITPNLCDDMHNTCPPLNDAVKQGDTWLAQNIPAILTSQAYQNGGMVMITWDEGEGGVDGPIGMIVLSRDAKGAGYSNTLHSTHSSTLRTLQEIFGVGPFLGDAANATDLHDLFKTFP